ncbi:MAG: N(4)-(beta-N-acetylglucosaminyl)-L-asparaginase [Gemmatimonadetes bacterium]|nr:N(4)-(beta-N-acetylglucosaminyl)-L-asparaginase [Gemmatimonadota bacterium]
MNERLSRRDFVRGAALAGVAAAAAPEVLQGFAGAPAVITRAARSLVIASANGHRYRAGGRQTAVEKAFASLTSGADVLEACVAGVNVNELDPEDTSVGYGGLPNAEGVVQLDSSCMHGPKKRAGAVAALEGVRTPSLVAKAVMEHTDHHLLVGKDAQRFARQMGFTIEDDLNTDTSRRLWLEWKRRTDPEHFPGKSRSDAAVRAGLSMVADGLIDAEHFWGTINLDALGPRGEIAGATTTSGLAWKIPGRVGDSPILGAGLYVDQDVGAAGSTGRGEANLYNLCSFLIVENMRRGMHPKDAALDALRRVQKNTVEKHLLNARGLPNFGLVFYVLNGKGEYAGVSLYPDRQYAVCTENGPQLLDCDALLTGTASDA